MDELRKAINELSEQVDERIARFAWREAIKPQTWKLMASLKLQASLNRRYGLGHLLDQVARLRWFHWLNPFSWKWVLPTSLYLLATRGDTASRLRSD